MDNCLNKALDLDFIISDWVSRITHSQKKKKERKPPKLTMAHFYNVC